MRVKQDKMDPKYLNIPNINFSLDYNKEDEEKYHDQRIKRGFDDTETWSLDMTISNFILPRLIRFTELTNGYPGGDFENFEEWKDVLEKIIQAFTIKTNNSYTYNKEDDKIIEEGLSLFAKYFNHLWW